MIEAKPRICEADSPHRCQATHNNGQCVYEARENSPYCQLHGGNRQFDSAANKIIRQYNVAKWQARIGEFAEHDMVKGLREEIGIVRMLLETVLNQCQSDFDLLLYSSKISDLVTKIESLVKSCHKLESSMGLLLDKGAALQLATEITDIVHRHVKDDEIVSTISKTIVEAMVRIEQRKPEE